MLSLSTATQALKPVSGRDCQFPKIANAIQLI
jgi:hypothetical protein